MKCRRLMYMFVVLAAVLGGLASAPPAAADGKIGIVLMHGKGAPTPQGLFGGLIEQLEGAGYLVVAPEMPWSKARNLAKGYEDSMVEIDDAVAALKAKGATRIVVGGQSMGANAALGYGARRDGLAGVIAIAPGHVPDIAGFQRMVGHDYKRAREMVDAGKGDQMAQFKDANQGQDATIPAKAADYLSWFDPGGPALFPKNAAALRPGTALLWIIGDKDNMLKRGHGEDYAFAKAPQHPKSAYVVIASNHRNTPADGAERIVEWLKGL